MQNAENLQSSAKVKSAMKTLIPRNFTRVFVTCVLILTISVRYTHADDEDSKVEGIATQFLKGSISDQDAAKAGVDAAIGIIELGFPVAAPVLGILKGLFEGGASAPSATAVLDGRMTKAENNIANLNTTLSNLKVQVDQLANTSRLQIIKTRQFDIHEKERALKTVSTMTKVDKRNLVDSTLELANRFLTTDPTNLDLWQWNDILVKADPDNKTNGTLKVLVTKSTRPRFEINLQIQDYLETLAVLVAAINSTGEGISASDVQHHVAFLTQNPMGQDGQPMSAKNDPKGYLWPMPLAQHAFPVNCTADIGSRNVDKNGMCSWHLVCRGASIYTDNVPFKSSSNVLCTAPGLLTCHGQGANRKCTVSDGLGGNGLEQQYQQLELAAGKLGPVADAMMAAANALKKAGTVEPKFDTTSYGGGGLLFAVSPSGSLYEFEDVKATRPNGHIVHKLNAIRKVDEGWDQFAKVFPVFFNENMLVVFGIKPNGDVMQMAIQNYRSGTVTVRKNKDRVGNGWNSLTKVFSTGEGVIYGVKPNGDLIWYRHKKPAFFPGGYNWANENPVGIGWNGFQHLFSTGEGFIYGVKDNYDLYWYHHIAYQTGEGLSQGPGRWEDPARKIGNGWDFKQMAVGEEGAIYCVKANGELWAYRHLGWRTGKPDWEPSVKLANDWGNYLNIFGASGAQPVQGPR